GDSLVLPGVIGSVRLGVGITLAIAIKIKYNWSPALRCFFIPCLQIFFRVQPTYYRPATAGPKRVVIIFSKHQVMRAETGVYGSVFPCPGVIDTKLPV